MTEAEQLSAALEDLILRLSTNDWPLGANLRPFTNLGGSWPPLTDEERKDSALVLDRRRAETQEAECVKWRADVRLLVERLGSFLFTNGQYSDETFKAFQGSRLVMILRYNDPLMMESYRTVLCLIDLEELKRLLDKPKVSGWVAAAFRRLGWGKVLGV